MASRKVKKLIKNVNAGMNYYEQNRDRINENVNHAAASIQGAAQKVRATKQAVANARAKVTPIAKKKPGVPRNTPVRQQRQYS
jgi:hypothetical protein